MVERIEQQRIDAKRLCGYASRRAGYSTEVTKEVFDGIIEEMTYQLAIGSVISIKHFGTIGVLRRKAYTGTHPLTGEVKHYKSKLLPYITFHKYIRRVIANSKKIVRDEQLAKEAARKAESSSSHPQPPIPSEPQQPE